MYPCTQILRRLSYVVIVFLATAQPVAGQARFCPTDTTELFKAESDCSETNRDGLGDASAWQQASSLDLQRRSHTATVLLSGKVLVTGGFRHSETLSASEIFDPQTGEWSVAGDLMTSREKHTATLLTSGEVLVVGGFVRRQETDGPARTANTAEVYDPVTQTWSKSEGNTLLMRQNHTATLLPSGQVLIVGGEYGEDPNTTPLDTAAIYTPETSQWKPVTNSPDNSPDNSPPKRAYHTATLLPSGHVLVAGGRNAEGALKTVSIFVPGHQQSSAGKWVQGPELSQGYAEHTATLLENGEVLVVGGGSAESYLPTVNDNGEYSGSWTVRDCPGIAREGHNATLLPSGELLVTGGRSSSEEDLLSSVEVFAPKINAWHSVRPLGEGRQNNTATLLPSGKVLIAGGEKSNHSPANILSSVEVYDPGLERYNPVLSEGLEIDMKGRRAQHTATLTPDNEVLVVGGEQQDILTAEIYGSGNSWELSNHPENTPRMAHTATLLNNGKILLVGGTTNNSVGMAIAELYNSEGGGSLECVRKPSKARLWHTATLLPSGEVLIIGGRNAGTEIEIFDPSVPSDPNVSCDPSNSCDSTDSCDPNNSPWRIAGHLTTPRHQHTATLLPTGEVLIVGGYATGARGTAELYNPVTEESVSLGTTPSRRHDHTATLLPSGQVLVVGGFDRTRSLKITDVDLYDPWSRSWTEAPPLGDARRGHSATLLHSGHVLVVGGEGNSRIKSVEVFDPATRSWTFIRDLEHERADHTATLLPSGDVLIAGGEREPNGAPASSELYWIDDPTMPGFPMIESFNGPISYGTDTSFSLSGQFRPRSEAFGGTTASSAMPQPFVQLRSKDGQRQYSLAPDTPQYFWGELSTLKFSELPLGLYPGDYQLTVTSGGITSEPYIVTVECGLRITEQPKSVQVDAGGSATFSVSTAGGLFYQWERCQGGVDACRDSNGPDDPGGSGWLTIEGAVSNSYTIGGVLGSDTGTNYRVRVHSGCTTVTSESAKIFVNDDVSPKAEVLTPRGGELWQLSDDKRNNVEVVSWTMSDNIRTCQVDVDLLYTTDGTSSPDEPSLCTGPSPSDERTIHLADFGSVEDCYGPGLPTTSFEYTVPDQFPSGQANSDYRIRVTVTDHAGNSTTTCSEHPFYIVEPNDESIKTLILWHKGRLDADGLQQKLKDFAGAVEGRIVGLHVVEELVAPYNTWDSTPQDASLDEYANNANHVVKAIHVYLEGLRKNYPAVKYLVLVGGDNVIPMARLKDRTDDDVSEATYRSDDLTTNTTVGRAIAGDYYLSDDPIATLGELDLYKRFFLPDLPVGRLVETGPEIIALINIYLTKGGGVGLTEEDDVLITAYDFLVDVGEEIEDRWSSEQPVTTLIDDWDDPPSECAFEANVQACTLRKELCASYPVVSLNGHATHHEIGIPGETASNIQGLPTTSLDCALHGSLVYAVGCHSGLPVDDSVADLPGEDRIRDMPQAMLGAGVVAFLGNTGYGWGMVNSIGYSERLVEIFTNELMAGQNVTVGKAVQKAKERYYSEAIHYDAYDEKVSMQWTLFGFPMLELRRPNAPAADPPALPTDMGQYAPVSIDRREVSSTWTDGLLITGPPFMSRLLITADFSADGIYEKHTVITADPECSEGCSYYELNNASFGQDLYSAATDRPIEPVFVFDARYPNASLHGALWMGGLYVEENDWTPLIATLQSNFEDDFSDRAPLVQNSRPNGKGRTDPDYPCAAADTEFARLVFETGELLPNPDEGDIHRYYEEVEFELLYLNHRDVRNANCDRTGPEIMEVRHDVTGSTIAWEVKAKDILPPALPDVDPGPQNGVWRVVVNWNDNTTEVGADGKARGRWHAQELQYDSAADLWRGSRDVLNSSRLSYFVQAVDNRGNVSTPIVVQNAEDVPPSGVPTNFPEVVVVDIAPGPSNLAVAVDTLTERIRGLASFGVDVNITNHGPEVAAGVRVTTSLPGVTDLSASAIGWTCEVDDDEVICVTGSLELGQAPQIHISGTAPPAGEVLMTAEVSALGEDDDLKNNSASKSLLVVAAPMADLKVDQSVSLENMWSPVFKIQVSNAGPDNVTAAEVSNIVSGVLSEVEWTCESFQASCPNKNGGGDISEIVDMTSGGWLLFTLLGTLDQGFGGVLTNVVTVTAPSRVYDPDLESNSSVFRMDYHPLISIFQDGFESGDLGEWSESVP